MCWQTAHERSLAGARNCRRCLWWCMFISPSLLSKWRNEGLGRVDLMLIKFAKWMNTFLKGWSSLSWLWGMQTGPNFSSVLYICKCTTFPNSLDSGAKYLPANESYALVAVLDGLEIRGTECYGWFLLPIRQPVTLLSITTSTIYISSPLSPRLSSYFANLLTFCNAVSGNWNVCSLTFWRAHPLRTRVWCSSHGQYFRVIFDVVMSKARPCPSQDLVTSRHNIRFSFAGTHLPGHSCAYVDVGVYWLVSGLINCMAGLMWHLCIWRV